jgi:Zn-dependent M28 family amino/carboxypeptidase
MLTACTQQKSVAASADPLPAASNAAQSAAPAPVVDYGPTPRFSGNRAMQYAREIVGFGPRYVSSPGHAKVEAYLHSKLKGDNLEEDKFTASTPYGKFPMTNYIDKFPGTKNGIIVISGHYDTLYKRNDFVGANDGGSSTAILLELANQFRSEEKKGKLDGYSVWLVWFDGEEAFRNWTDTDSVYGSRQLADQWKQDGTAAKIKALILTDMIGDSDLNLEQDVNSSPELLKLVYAAASHLGYQSHFFARQVGMVDDHIPFAKIGVPVIDLIDFNYGYDDAFWHTEEDTIDKLSPESFEIVGKVILQSVEILNKQ